jgi:DNA-binding NarL/FixJ family response regulator
VLLADDHGIARRGLKALLEEAGLSVVAEAADASRPCGSAKSTALTY